jgi:hypothetical protein
VKSYSKLHPEHFSRWKLSKWWRFESILCWTRTSTTDNRQTHRCDVDAKIRAIGWNFSSEGAAVFWDLAAFFPLFSILWASNRTPHCIIIRVPVQSSEYLCSKTHTVRDNNQPG